MRTALVTGSSGFLGKNLVARLKSEGYWVRGLDRVEAVTGVDEFVLSGIGSVGNWGTVLKREGNAVDELYHLAADFGGIRYNRALGGVLRKNLEGTMDVLRGVEEVGVKKIFFPSSVSVYPEGEEVGVSVFSEEDAYPANPPDEYGWMKLLSERLVKECADASGVKARMARIASVYGVGSNWSGGKELLPPALCVQVCKVVEGGSVRLLGSGESIRSYVEVADCVEGIRVLMESDRETPVNLVDWEASVKEVAELVVRASGKRVGIEVGTEKVSGIRRVSGSVLREMGWKPVVPREEGFRKLWEWIRRMA